MSLFFPDTIEYRRLRLDRDRRLASTRSSRGVLHQRVAGPDAPASRFAREHPAISMGLAAGGGLIGGLLLLRVARPVGKFTWGALKRPVFLGLSSAAAQIVRASVSAPEE